MKGFELTKAIDEEVRKKGTAGSEIQGIGPDGEVFAFGQVETEQQSDGTYLTWIHMEPIDG